MKVVIDTNVIVSAALKDRDPEAVILFVAAHPDFQWVVSAPILDEYKAVLGREKFNLPKTLLQKWHEMLDLLTITVEVNLELNFPRDRKDAKFLECAMAADADYLITGDKDFTEAHKMVDTTIISVALLKKLVCDAWH